MKIRNGYVSNSSSSSFFMLASSFDAKKVGDAIDSFFDFYDLSKERRDEIIKEMSDINDDLDEAIYDCEVEELLDNCVLQVGKIKLRFGNLDNGLEDGKGYFVYYSDYTDDCGYFDNPSAIDISTYIGYANKLKAICDKNHLEISNLQIINGTASC